MIQRDVIDVVEVGGVVAVQVRQEEPAQGRGARSGRGGAHEDAAPAVEEQVARRRAHQRGRAGPLRVGERDATAEDDRLHARRV